MAPCIFQLFFQSFVDLGAFWYHPTTCFENKGLNEDLSTSLLFVILNTYPSLYHHVFGRYAKGTV